LLLDIVLVAVAPPIPGMAVLLPMTVMVMTKVMETEMILHLLLVHHPHQDPQNHILAMILNVDTTERSTMD
jgi:hypothetical protein